MKASKILISVYEFELVCISICTHVYVNSYIHELLIVFMLTMLHLWFETSLWLITWFEAYLHHLYSGFVSSSNSILDGLLDDDVTS